jgi:two-component system, OmpR family, sensor histidine kinase KdpD
MQKHDMKGRPSTIVSPVLAAIASAVAMLAACILIGIFIEPFIGLANLAFLFLLPVVAIAGRFGLAAGLATAAATTLCFNFAFVPPRWTLHVARIDNVVTLVMLAATAVLVSHFAARLKAQAERARQLADDSALLSQLSFDLSQLGDIETLRQYLCTQLERVTGAQVQLIDSMHCAAQDWRLGPLDHSAATWALSHGEAAGRGTALLAGADALFLPVAIGGDDRWLAQFWRGDAHPPVSTGRLSLVEQMLTRGGEAIHRAHVMHQQADIEARQSEDNMRETLLASISHDLRTPLTGICAGLDALPHDPDGVVEATRAEAARLQRMVSNLLDLARIRANAVALTREATDLTDAIDAAIAAMERPLRTHRVDIEIEPQLPLVQTDPRLLHHMLINLIENACKFSPEDAPVTISAVRSGADIHLSVIDCGPGLPDMAGSDMFGRFQRGTNADRVPGSGLGLAVVAGFAQAIGVSISAATEIGPHAGSRLIIGFPASLCLEGSIE